MFSGYGKASKMVLLILQRTQFFSVPLTWFLQMVSWFNVSYIIMNCPSCVFCIEVLGRVWTALLSTHQIIDVSNLHIRTYERNGSHVHFLRLLLLPTWLSLHAYVLGLNRGKIMLLWLNFFFNFHILYFLDSHALCASRYMTSLCCLYSYVIFICHRCQMSCGPHGSILLHVLAVNVPNLSWAHLVNVILLGFQHRTKKLVIEACIRPDTSACNKNMVLLYSIICIKLNFRHDISMNMTFLAKHTHILCTDLICLIRIKV